MHRWQKLQADLPWFGLFALATAAFVALCLNNAKEFLGVVAMDAFVAMYVPSLVGCWMGRTAKHRETMTWKRRCILAGLVAALVGTMLLTYQIVKPPYTVSDGLKAVRASGQVVSVSIHPAYAVMDCEPPLGILVRKGYMFRASTQEAGERTLFFDPISGRYDWMD